MSARADTSRHKLPRHLKFCVGDKDPSGQNWSDTLCRRRHDATCRRHFQLRWQRHHQHHHHRLPSLHNRSLLLPTPLPLPLPLSLPMLPPPRPCPCLCYHHRCSIRQRHCPYGAPVDGWLLCCLSPLAYCVVRHPNLSAPAVVQSSTLLPPGCCPLLLTITSRCPVALLPSINRLCRSR
jgi:hypothetical protein